MSYYLSAFLDTAGIRGATTQMNVQLGMNAIQIVFACVGSSLVDRLGRRPMLMLVNIACGLCWIGILVPASIANITDKDDKAQTAAVSSSVSSAILAWVYLFQICYSVGWTPLQALYPVEVLSYEMRGKGMAFSSLFMNIALLTTQFGVPVALKDIHWKTYIVFCVWCFVQAIVFFFLVPETKNRTVSLTNNPSVCKTSFSDTMSMHSSRSSTISSRPPTPSRPPSRRRNTRSTPTPTSSTSTLPAAPPSRRCCVTHASAGPMALRSVLPWTSFLLSSWARLSWVS